jgi:hypothetical protein
VPHDAASEAGDAGDAGGVGGDHVLTTLDPDKVYIAGYLDPGGETYPALGSWREPSRAFAGHPKAAISQLRGQDGLPIYDRVGSDFRDAVGFPDRWDPIARRYDIDPTQNDEPVRAECEGALGVAIPGSTQLLTTCRRRTVYEQAFDLFEIGKGVLTLPAASRVLRAGRNGLVLLEFGWDTWRVGSLDARQYRLVTRPDSCTNVLYTALRSSETGFFYVCGQQTPPGAEATPIPNPDFRLFDIDSTGKSTEIGAYPPTPSGISVIRTFACAIDAERRLFCYGADGDGEHILEFAIGAPVAKVVQTTTRKGIADPLPIVKNTGGAVLVSGP